MEPRRCVLLNDEARALPRDDLTGGLRGLRKIPLAAIFDEAVGFGPHSHRSGRLACLLGRFGPRAAVGGRFGWGPGLGSGAGFRRGLASAVGLAAGFCLCTAAAPGGAAG